ncbi:MAG: hypothetical protein IPJ07_23425 [Acidobacteria bacterium]|nr:hypothetical protein [Acidobacteriota bacterium]
MMSRLRAMSALKALRIGSGTRIFVRIGGPGSTSSQIRGEETRLVISRM